MTSLSSAVLPLKDEHASSQAQECDVRGEELSEGSRSNGAPGASPSHLGGLPYLTEDF